MMYTSGKNEGELDGGEGNVVGINNPSSLGGAKDDILLHGTPGFGRRRDADHDYDPSSKGKNLGFQNKQSGVHAAKKRRIGEIASSNISDQHNFLSPNNHGAPLQEEALRAISKGQSNQGSVFNLNQNIGKLSCRSRGFFGDAEREQVNRPQLMFLVVGVVRSS